MILPHAMITSSQIRSKSFVIKNVSVLDVSLISYLHKPKNYMSKIFLIQCGNFKLPVYQRLLSFNVVMNQKLK